MNPVTEEWGEKAEADFHVALRESRAREYRSFDAVCFHAQQCAEKYLKARLQEVGIAFPRTHSLPMLLNPACTVEPLWSALHPQAGRLSAYAVAFRYPGSNATKEEAKQALNDCRAVRSEARHSFGLPG